MQQYRRSPLGRFGTSAGIAFVVSAALLAGCTSSPMPDTASAPSSGSKEYFAESEYGVKASPRVSSLRTRLPRGGGRDMIGKPYKVKGQWYKPKEEPNYARTGAASWYGDAFHGRLTANGEVYDMTHLTAAHPTMPLPSYARVTNTTNGASVIVRVNDRGPFANNRVIDLSKRAAELLDYQHAGVAKVKVEYVGRAPLHGQDDNYLIASYRPGRSGVDKPGLIEDGLPGGVMIAMNGATPTTAKRSLFATAAASGQPLPPATGARIANLAVAAPVAVSAPGTVWSEVQPGDAVLPALGPVPPERPYDVFAPRPVATAALSYADSRIAAASSAIEAAVAPAVSEGDVRASWKRMGGVSSAPASGDYVLAGTYASRAEADRMAAALAGLGRISMTIEADALTVELRGADTAHLAELACGRGAEDAFLVRE